MFDYVIPALSDQKVNRHIKTVCRLTGIDQPIRITNYPGGIAQETIRPKYALVTNHTARRSFATNGYTSGIPSKLIMQILGMKSEETLFRYIRIEGEKLAEMAQGSKFFQ